MFFEKNKDIIKSLLNAKLSKFTNSFERNDEQKIYSEILKTSISIYIDIHNQPKIWDKYAPKNIESHGESLLKNLKEFTRFVIEFDNLNPFDDFHDFDELNGINDSDLIFPLIRELYLNSLRFLYEMDFRQKKSIEYDLINEVKRDSINYTTSNHLDGEFKSEILYIIHSTPYLITKDLFHSDEIKLFANFEDNKLAAENTLNRIETSNTTVEKQLSSFKSELDEKIDTVKSLKETLDKQETAFNFVGLYKGFNSLAKRKQKESTNSFTFLVILSFALIIFPIYGMITVYSPSSDINKYTPLNHLLAFLPLISLELILIYFFRVVLHNYKSIQAQILQIELRQTLCQFIQNYADYSKEIKKDDPTALDKFENLIFSGIINDAQNLPSTFDGMDQIGKLLSSLKSKG